MATEERVLCFKRTLLEDLGVFQGICPDVEKYLPVVTAPANVLYLNRSEAELDKNFKQLIPYVLILCNDKILRYRRGKGGGEKRLHGLYSVGIGGHISEEDTGTTDGPGYYEGMRRELMEEVALEKGDEAAVGLINDDSTEVGAVHFGVVHIMAANDESILSQDSGIAEPEFVSIPEALKDLSVYESWSRFCLENLDSMLARAAAAGLNVSERVAS